MLRGYIPTLLASIFICWLIVLMQFLWKYVDELLGKGLDYWIVGQILFYAAMTFLPMALPLGILLGSLIYFGNQGERLELLAMKAAGISLYRMLAPLMTLIVSIAIGLFIFQNDFLITSQVRMWTLLYSARMSNPELEIPERIFYNGLNGYSIYVSARDREHPGRMLDVMIYDYQKGSEQVRIVRADSGRMVMDEGKTYLSWRLYNGQSFENLEMPTYMSDKPIAHAKERFDYKEIIIPFDANFQKQDESHMKNLYVGKNIIELQSAFDSATLLLDSIRSETRALLDRSQYSQRYSYDMPYYADTSSWAKERLRQLDVSASRDQIPINLDSLKSVPTLEDSIRIVSTAIGSLERVSYEAQGRLYSDNEVFREFRTNGQEWHRKFTFPAACIIFFLIGAPLGAIIRKGGLGMPIVSAVVFFIFYYIIDTFGLNMTKSEEIPVWFGMWLSSMVLLPMGIFLTYGSAKDAIVINTDRLLELWNRGRGTYIRRRELLPLSAPELQGEMMPYQNLTEVTLLLVQEAQRLHSESWLNSSTMSLWLSGEGHREALEQYRDQIELFVQQIRLLNNPLVSSKVADLPLLPTDLIPRGLPRRRALRIALLLFVPISLPVLLLIRSNRERLSYNLEATSLVLAELHPLLERYAPSN